MPFEILESKAPPKINKKTLMKTLYVERRAS
jgi:hypothetical protein